MAEYVFKEDKVVAYEQAPSGTEPVRTYKEFSRYGKDWKTNRLVELYNSIATPLGRSSVRKFTNRETGMKRVWDVIQELPLTPIAPVSAGKVSKKQTVLDLVQQTGGATLDEIMNATGWQAHSVRGFLSTQRKDYEINRVSRNDNTTAYYATKK